MNKQGPIVFIDDDADDKMIMTQIFSELRIKNELVWILNGIEAIDYLKKDEVPPFIIISDLNMPVISGYETRKIVFANPGLREKCVPYIFMSSEANPAIVKLSYEQSIQGFFKKPVGYINWKILVSEIITYWRRSL